MQTVHAQTIGNDNVQFPIFSEYQIETTIKFRVMKWHEYFDCLIGTADFVNLQAKIDYDKRLLTVGGIDIPLYFHSPYKQPDFVASHDPKFVTVPVNIKEGDIYFPYVNHEGTHFPDGILHAENYQVKYPTDNNLLNSEFHQPIMVEPVENISIQPIEINSVSDQGGEFENSLIKEYCKASNIEYHATTPLNSSSNSPVERFNSTLLEKLRILKDKDKFTPLDQILTTVIINYNSSIHATTKRPPFNILYGPHYDALDHMFRPSVLVDEYIQRQSDQIRALKDKQPQANTSTFSHTYQVGETVYVLSPLTRNQKSKNLYNEGTIIRIEGNKIHCKMKNGRIHVRNFRDIKPNRKHPT